MRTSLGLTVLASNPVVVAVESVDVRSHHVHWAADIGRSIAAAGRAVDITRNRHAPLLVKAERRILTGFAESMIAIADGLVEALESEDPVGIARYWRWACYAAGPIALATTTGLTQGVAGHLLDAPSIHQQAEAVASTPPLTEHDLVEFHQQNIERALAEVGIDLVRVDRLLYADDDIPGVPHRIDMDSP